MRIEIDSGPAQVSTNIERMDGRPLDLSCVARTNGLFVWVGSETVSGAELKIQTTPEFAERMARAILAECESWKRRGGHE